MDDRTPKTEAPTSAARRGTWKNLVLPTLLTVAVGSIGSISAQSSHLLGSSWRMVNESPLSLDSKPFDNADKNDGSVATFGVSPYYFVSYHSPDGQSHLVKLANKKGSRIVDARLPLVDPGKHSVRFLVVLKDHRRVPFDENRSVVVTSDGLPVTRSVSNFTGPREGVKARFLPADVSSVELQIRSRR